MTPTLEQLKALLPDLDEELAAEHLARLPARYFERYGAPQIARHIERLQRISPAHPVELMFDRQEDGTLECTVCAFDYPSEFSLITGLLASSGFDIQSGDVFTYAANEPTKRSAPAAERRARALAASRSGAQLERRRIVDQFRGTVTGSIEAFCSDITSVMQEVFTLLERGRDGLAEAKRRVNERVAECLARLRLDSLAALYPVHIQVDEGVPDRTRIRVVSEDTPFFLSSFSTALALRGISIEHVTIRTQDRRIEDTFELVDAARGGPLDPITLDQVRLSVLLTKQFTYFLARAPDPYMALTRFETLIEEILEVPQQGRWVDLLSNPQVMADLAKLLGTSDFLWEDFIRTQYESLIPMLRPAVEGRGFATPPERLPAALREALAAARDDDDRVRILNAFKDREAYLIDLESILDPGVDFRRLSERLSRLAECVIQAAFDLAWQRAVRRYGPPMTVAGLEARYAILGLGKLGGEALGYASDIEFLFVYSDSGETRGPEVASNAEFFEQLVQDAVSMIHAKRAGIFEVDLRLRPYGGKGPLAVSLASFCRYYDRSGPAHSFERLALVRMRAIGGDPDFGATLERLRDRMVYVPDSIRLDELRSLREKQLEEKTHGANRPNAKFSRGALVDLEYAVQILQVVHGAKNPRLRTPSVHKALDRLAESGVIRRQEAEALADAYRLLRNLINALRMLRGSAQDLFLPEKDSIEFTHLARRMGYSRRGNLPPETALRLDFETATANVRAFIERHFGQSTLPAEGVANVADIVLSMPSDEARSTGLLAELGFSDPQRALRNLQALAGADQERRETFARLAILACDTLARSADPDMALNNWERFVQATGDPLEHFRSLLAQPMALDILMRLFASSQFLSDTLIRHPEFLPWVTDPRHVHELRDTRALADELRALAAESEDDASWRDALRRLRRRELLRIGVRDLILAKPLAEITLELSRLADAVTRGALDRIWATWEAEAPTESFRAREGFCVLALGKLGAEELNYSSDIDLLAICHLGPGSDAEALLATYQRIMERLRDDLAKHTLEGAAYRVDLRLRPYGRSGLLVHPIEAVVRYYEQTARLWEVQALLKARPIAGSLEIGERLLARLRPLLLAPRPGPQIAESIERMRDRATAQAGATDVKSGLGGIRDLEFLVQGLQLAYAPEQPQLLVGNTLEALRRLESAGVLGSPAAAQIREDYTLLRRIEHALQILDDRQRHRLPEQPEELRALARRLFGISSHEADLERRLADCQARVRSTYEQTLARLRAMQAPTSSRGPGGR